MEEFAERFDSAIFYLHSIDLKQDQMLEKQDTVIGLQIDTLREIKIFDLISRKRLPRS